MRGAVKGVAFLALLAAFVGLDFWAGYSAGVTKTLLADKEIREKLEQIGMATKLLMKPEGDKR